MYENFGAVVDQQKKSVEFKLFFPDRSLDSKQYQNGRGGLPKIKEIRVTGDFQSKTGGKDWDFGHAPLMTKDKYPDPNPKGWLYTCKIPKLADGFYQYKYFVTFENGTTRWCTDPCTKYGGEDDNENAAFVIGGNITTVNPIGNRLPQKDLIIYELMIDDFTAEFRGEKAPIDAIKMKLDYLQTLGVNAVEFMPWTAWPGGEFSWGYNPFLFFSVEHRYTNDESNPTDKLYRLMTLINELHSRNMHVIMDGVFNHVNSGINPNKGFPYRWLYQDPEDSPYIGAFSGGGFFDDFYYYNGCAQEFIRDVCIYWFDKYKIDGIRFDYTLGFYIEGQKEGIPKLIDDIKAYLADQGEQNVSLILEHLTDNRYQAIDDTNKICASGCWFDPFMWNSSRYAHNGNIDMDILRILDANRDFTTDKGPVTYIENHDHSTIINDVGGRERWFKTQPAAITLLTSPGAVLIHNGQEFGEDYWLPESGNGRVVPRPLHWKEYSQDFIGQRLYAIYQRLIEIRKNYPQLRSPNFFPAANDGLYGAFPDQDVVVYHRWGSGSGGNLVRFIIVVNYSDYDQWIDIPFSIPGWWEDLLNDNSVNVNGYVLPNQRINSNWGRIYVNK